MENGAYVYILASKRNGTLYVGVTTDLAKRVWQHKCGEAPGFTHKYNVKLLVYYAGFEDLKTARAKERALKKWRRSWKLELIETGNPDWRDLYQDLLR